jgi:hypothetical protein
VEDIGVPPTADKLLLTISFFKDKQWRISESRLRRINFSSQYPSSRINSGGYRSPAYGG